MFENCLWDLFKPNIWIFFPCRFLEGYGEGAGRVFLNFHIIWFIQLIYNLIQVIRTSNCFIDKFCLLYLMNQCSLILRLVLEHVRKLSQECTKIRQFFFNRLVCGRLWKELWLCDFTCCYQFIHWNQVNYPKIFLLIVTINIFSSEIRRRLDIYRFINIIGDS